MNLIARPHTLRKSLALLLTTAAAVVAFAATSSPEEDRKQLIELYRSKFPDLKADDYSLGALNFSRDAKAQYDSMMDMPPWESTLARAKTAWETPFQNGKTFASCFPNGGRNVAGGYPQFDTSLGKVVTFEMAINRCLRDNGEAEYRYDDMKTMGLLSLYGRALSDGAKTDIKVEGPQALAAYEAGKRFFYARRGQLNFACATCHVGDAGKRVRREFLSPVIGQTTHWPLFRGEATPTDLFTLQRRYAACSGLVRSVPLALGSAEYNDLEYFHTYQSNGLPIKSGVWRK